MKRKVFLPLLAVTAFMLCSCSSTTTEQPDNIPDSTIESSVSDTSSNTDISAESSTDVPAAQVSSPYGTPIETLDEFFSNGSDAGYICSLQAAPDSLSVVYNSSKQLYAWFDLEGNVFYESSSSNASPFIGNKCKMSSQTMLAMENGALTIVTPTCIQNSPESKIINYCKDSTGYTLWTARKEDILDGSNIILTAWDDDGNEKLSISTADLPIQDFDVTECFDSLSVRENYRYSLYSGPSYESGPYYVWRIYRGKENDEFYCTINIETGEISTGADSRGSDLYIQDDIGIDTYANSYDFSILDLDFSAPYFPTRVTMSSTVFPVYSHGLMYLKSDSVPSGYYDSNGNQVIDLSNYSVKEAHPFNADGVAVIELKNPDGVEFCGLLSTDGNWVLEPQKAKEVYVSSGYAMLINDSGYQIYDPSGTPCNNLFSDKNFDHLTSSSMSEPNDDGERICHIDSDSHEDGTFKVSIAVVDKDNNYKYLTTFNGVY